MLQQGLPSGAQLQYASGGSPALPVPRSIAVLCYKVWGYCCVCGVCGAVYKQTWKHSEDLEGLAPVFSQHIKIYWNYLDVTRDV